jgi:hypothetical protein
MASYHKSYPIGSVSHGTMRPEDLIPDFVYELRSQARRRNLRSKHLQLCRSIEARMSKDGYYESEESDSDLEFLFDALGEYAAPYFYFGAHPGDGSDYGFWLSESWDEDFEDVKDGDIWRHGKLKPIYRDDMPSAIKVNDIADIPKWFRGEVAVVNDHGNVTLYVKTSRKLHEVWAVV